jgi:bacteriocin biosynthesis cyclodehydratase domain-containing protein
MLRCPLFKPHLHVERLPGEGIVVLSELGGTILRGRLYEAIVPHLDGRPVEELYRVLAPCASVAQVHYTIGRLEQQGFLCDGSEGPDPQTAAFWTSQGSDPLQAVRRLAETTVALDAYGIDAAPLAALLQALGVRVDTPGDVGLVVTDHYLRRELSAYNGEALRSGRPWLLVKPTGTTIWIGPLFRPGITGCWECLARRMRANNPLVGYLDSMRGDRGPPPLDGCRTPATETIGWGLAAHAVASWIGRGDERPLLEGKLQTIDLVHYHQQSHRLIRQPACPACGSGAVPLDVTTPPLVLQSRKKTYTDDGGHRAQTPQETLDRYADHISPICGTVSALDRTGPADDGVMHVYISGSNIARRQRNLANVRRDLRSSTCGKGTTDLQARASALCEAIERYSGAFQGNERRRTARYVDLGEQAIHPNACMLFSDRQYRDRELLNSGCCKYTFVPVPFDPERQIEWTPVWSLTRAAVRYLPTSYCYFDYPAEPEMEFCPACSNGNAAGNCLEEAILQGFFELIERDSVGLWWYNRARVPALDLESVEDPYPRRLHDYLAGRGRELWVLDVTSDFAIPAFTAVSRWATGPAEEIMFGFGAHADPRIALLRALTELNQMLVPLLVDTPAEQRPFFDDPETAQWLQTATVADHPYLAPRPGPLRRFESFPHAWTDDLREDILLCKATVERLGFEFLVLDQTRPETGMPVAKVFVPGLRHFWTRFAPGRLYDVPVRLGWVAQALTEDELNPIPMFL